jgi:hypothetical protein
MIMKRVFTVFILLFLSALPVLADSPPGGDVLRPKREGASGFHWYLGLDAGLTWSSFYNGPAHIYAPNPYFEHHPFLSGTQDVSWVSFDVSDGSGLGFIVGGVVDLSFTRYFGLVGKINYHTRVGSFDYSASSTVPIYQNGQWTTTNVSYKDTHDWQLNFFAFDLLARIQLVPESWYILIGPSFSSLSKNTFDYQKQILAPDNIFWLEESTVGGLGTPNQYRSMKGSWEVPNLNSTRVDLKGGVGVWIPLTETLFLTPELTAALPLTKLESSMDYNMFTLFATVGLRWKMD